MTYKTFSRVVSPRSAMAVAGLLCCFIIILTACLTRRSLQQTSEDRKKVSQVINQEYASLGKIRWQEGVTLIHFILLILLWLGRYPAKAGGWGLLFPKGLVYVNITYLTLNIICEKTSNY